MKNRALIFLSLALIILIVPGMAQISLDIEDLPQPGKALISVNVDSAQGAALSPGISGADITWDFNMLQPCCGSPTASSDTITWRNHTATANAGYFPLSNIARQERCYSYHSHVTHTDATECYYNHYIRDNTGLLYYGLEDPVMAIFNNSLNVFPLLAFGDSLQNVAKIHIPVSVDTTRIYHIISKSVADGWGTLITPDTTVQVLRIRTTEILYDTLYVNDVIRDVRVYPDNYYYRWYAKNTGFPVLEINKGFQNQQPPFFQKVSYAKKSYSALGINVANPTNGFTVFPNPFSSVVTIQPGAGKTLLSFTLFNSIGKKVMSRDQISDNKILIDGEMLPSGIYFYTATLNNNGAFSGKIIKF
ncbi:MAG: T9SS type A sorting domain-containing protein [Bacteroidales bacterium]|nr:T9SS type A sorting domain-containing protein [Bacteroidales bacterium]